MLCFLMKVCSYVGRIKSIFYFSKIYNMLYVFCQIFVLGLLVAIQHPKIFWKVEFRILVGPPSRALPKISSLKFLLNLTGKGQSW